MSFIKKQSLHKRKVGDKSFILTADGNIEMNLDAGKTFTVDADFIATGDVSGPKTENVFYVTKDGSDDNDGRSSDGKGAFATIKKAAEVAPSGSTIIVAPGDYFEENPITLKDFVTITGQGELRNTRLFPKNNTSDFFYMGNGCYLYQLTFRALRAPGWCVKIRPGALVTTSPYVQNCTNMNGPWLNDGTEFIPFETVQIEGIEPGARPLTLADNPSLPFDKQVNLTGGGGGMFVDGDEYDPASLVFSFVADAFTQIAQGGPGFEVTNFGYTQIVSCFSVFCSTGFKTTKGGYLSISNSVSDFGTFGCVADGFYPIAYTQAVPTEDYFSTVGSITINQPGVGYTSNPTITIESPDGAGGVTATATGQVDLTTGQLAAITITNNGSGYTSVPTVTITGGGATIQAEGTVNLTTNSVISLASLRDKPQTGSIIKFDGDDTYYYITANSITKTPFNYNEETCKRDVRRIVDAVTGDIVLGTYYQTTAAATSYLRSTSTKVILDQLEPTIYAIEAARDQMKARTTNLAMKEEIDQRFNIITTTLAAGDSTETEFVGSDFVNALNDINSIDNEIIEAKNNILANRDFIIEELTAYINDQFTELSYNQTKYTSEMSEFITSMAYYVGFNGSDHKVLRAAREWSNSRARFNDMMISSLRYLQQRFLALSEVQASAVAVTNVNEAFEQLANIIDEGDSAGITTEFPAAVGTNQNEIDARDQLIANMDFLKAEFIAYLDSINSTISYTQSKFEQDVENAVNSVIYDIMYGGNTATKKEADYYFNSETWSSNYTQVERQAIIDSWARTRFAMQRIVRGLSITPTTGNAQTQDFTSGTATQIEANIADSLIQYYETVLTDLALTNLPLDALPLYDDESVLQQAAANTILAQRDNFIEDAIAYNLANNPTLTYDVSKCKRDVEYIIDAIYSDAQLGTNHRSITAGLAYQRANVAYLNTEQKPATIIAMREAKRLLVAAANGNSTFQTDVSNLFDVVLDIIEFNQLPSEGTVYPEPGPASTELINSTNQLIANKDFLVAEVIAKIAVDNFVYDQAKCERDTGIILDGVYYDAAFGTNYNAVTSGLAYQRGNSAKVISDQITETVGALTFAKGEAATALVSNTTAVSRSNAAFDEIIDIIQNGAEGTDQAADPLTFPNPTSATAAQIAAKEQLQNNRDFLAAEAVSYIQNNYQNFTYNSEKCERDVGLIMDAVALDVVLGTNFNAVTAGLAYQRASNDYLQDNQKIQTLSALRQLKKEIVEIGLSDAAEPLAEAAMDEVIDILENGVISTDTAADALVFPAPSSLPTANAVEAKDQLVANKEFIKDEIIAWIGVNYPALTYDAVKCERDVGYIIDALCHDILYGGNSATKIAAESYFVGAASQLGSGQQAATVAAYQRLKDVVGDVVMELSVVKSAGNALNQDTSGTPASSTEADDVEGLVQIIEDVIAAGNISGLPATQYPSLTWAANDLQEAYSQIKGNKEFVQERILIHIANNFQSFDYDEVKCRRDVGIMIEAVAYDAAIGTNYNSVTAGLAYQRANSSYVLSGQNLQTVLAIRYLRDQIAANGTLQSSFRSATTAGFNEIIDIIENGVVSTDTAADALVFPDPGIDANQVNAKDRMIANKEYAAKETSAFVTNNYPAVVFDSTKCERDVKYIIDALCYDIMYGGNLATKQAAESYFVGAASQLGAGQATATVAAYNELANLLSDIVQNIAHASNEQVVVTQDTSGSASDAGTGGEIQDLLQIIEDVIAAGNITNIPADSNTDITWTSVLNQDNFTSLVATTSDYQNLVINYIERTFTRTFTFNATKCNRDTKYIVDALTYDIIYGGNAATLDAARSYYVGTTSQVTGQQQETANALGWIKTLLGDVLLDVAVADPEQTAETQDVTAGAASATEVTRAETLLQIIQDVITDGLDQLPTETFPSTGWISAGIQTAIDNLVSEKTTIVNDTISYIETTYNGFSYDIDKCSRDTGYIIDAVTHDLLYQGNIATLIATRAYFLGTANYLPDEQKDITVAAYEHLAQVAADCIEGTAVTPSVGNTEPQVLGGAYGTSTESGQAVLLFRIPKNAIDNGTLVGTPAEIQPDFAWLPSTIKSAATDMLAQKVNIQNGVISYITDNLIDFEYNIEKCKRDTGYIIEALIYDLMYGGNKQTRRAAQAYYDGAILGAAKVGNADQVLVTAYSYYYLGDILAKVAKNETVTKSYNNTEVQVITTPDSDDTTATRIELLIDRIALSVLEGYTTGWQENNHNYELGSGAYLTERNTILADLESIVTTTIDDLNAEYGGEANITIFPGVISVTQDKKANLYNVSTISTSGHAFEYVGAGVDYNALPFFGGTAISENEIVQLNQGKVFAGGTVDQIGNFRVGDLFAVNALTGAIDLNANQISLEGLTSVGPFIRNGIPVGVELKEVSDNTNLLASTGTQDFQTAPTQRAVGIYVENRYLNKLTGGTVTGNIVLNGDFDVNGDVISTDTSGTFNLLNTSATTIEAFGDATTINMGAPTGTFTINPDLVVEGDLTVNGDIVLTGDYSLNIPDESLQAYSISTEGSLDYVSINTRTDEEKITFGERPQVEIQNLIESTSTTTGALVVDGGVGIAKSLYVGIDFTANGNVILGDDRAVDTLDINATTDIDVPDNATDVFRIHENINDYISINTTDNSEVVEFGATPNIIILNADDATDNVTGALQVTGGISTQVNVHAGQDIVADRDIIADRDIEVNGTNIITDETGTFNVFNTNATTINAFGDATAINIGADTGTLTVANEITIFDSVEAIQIPVGTDLERPTEATGQIRFNTDSTSFEGYDGTAWGSLGGVRDVDQDTFIRPESTPGADEDTITFHTNDVQRMSLGNTLLNIDATVKVTIDSTEVSSNYNTGALVVAGGVGIAKDLYVQGFISGNNSGVLQLTDLASDKILIKADTIESPESIKWISNAPDSAADDIVYPISLAHHSVSGSPAVGSGTGLRFELETSNSNYEIGGQIDSIVQDITGNQEDFDMVFSTMNSGSVTEKFRLSENTATITTSLQVNQNLTVTGLLDAASITASIYSDDSTEMLDAINNRLIVTTGQIGELTLTTDLEVQYGGTGVSTFTTNGILYGNTADPVQVTDAAGTSDASESFQILTVTSDVDATPVWTDTIDGGSF